MNWAVCSHCLSNSSCRLRGGAPSAVLGGIGEKGEKEKEEEGGGGKEEKGRVNLDLVPTHIIIPPSLPK